MERILNCLIFLSAISFTACVETVNSDQVITAVVHQSYYARYQEGSNETVVSADFRVGGSFGTTINLKAPSHVLADGIPLQKTSVIFGAGTRYQTSLPGFVPDVEMTWVDQEQRRYVNRLEMRTIQLTSAPSMVSSAQGFRVYFSAAGIDHNDRISASISQSGHGSSHYRSSSDVNTQQGWIQFSASDLDGLRSGTATLIVSRSRGGSLLEATSEGGYGTASYETAPVSISISAPAGLAAN